MTDALKSALRLLAGALRWSADGLDTLAGPKPVKPR